MQAGVGTFSWNVLIDGVDLQLPIANIRFSYAVDGFGEKGISTGQLEFDIYDKHDTVSELYLQGMSAVVVERENRYPPSKPYYLAKRSVNKHVIHFVAYDALSKTDKPFEIPYIPPAPSESENNSIANTGTIDGGGVMEAIKTQCGFASVSYTGGSDLLPLLKFTRAMLENKTCRQIMSEISVNLCGTWVADENGIIFTALGYPFSAAPATDKYAEINRQGKQKITKLMVTDTESGEITSYETGEYGTVIAIETAFPQIGSQVWAQIRGYEYSAWNCEKALFALNFTSDSHAVSMFMFGEEILTANSFTLSLDSTGIYFSGGSDARDEEAWRYQDYTQRELSQRVKIGKTVGNTQMTADGVVLVNKNTATGKTEKHGFSVMAKGLTTYLGAMTDKLLPKVNIKNDLTGFECDYGDDTKLKYELEWDGDNVTLKEQEEGG